MDKEKIRIISTILVAIGTILMLMMAFDIVPGKGNILVFAGVVCFILTGVVRAIFRPK